MQELNKLAKASGLKSFEQIKAIRLLTDGWTIEEGLLTPTLKNKVFSKLNFALKHSTCFSLSL